MKLLLEEASTDKKVLDNIKSRHKADKIFYDQRKFDLEKELVYLKKQLGIFQKEGSSVEESADRTIKIH
jgi:hypothetical protein